MSKNREPSVDFSGESIARQSAYGLNSPLVGVYPSLYSQAMITFRDLEYYSAWEKSIEYVLCIFVL